MGRKTYNDRIKSALERGRSDIAVEIRAERATAYADDMTKLSTEYAGQLKRGNVGGACMTLNVIIESATKQLDGLSKNI